MSTNTLNKDILLAPNQYDKYDFEFYKNDLRTVTGLESYSNAIKIAILTGYQELNKTNNPTYLDFGCKSYETLKANKSKDVTFEIESYIKQTIESMRRTQRVDAIQISEKQYGYEVYLRATSIDDTTAEVVLPLENSSSKINTVLYASTELAYCNQNIPLQVNISLKTYETNTPLTDIVYIYVNDDYIQTHNIKDGKSTFTYTPTNQNMDNSMKIIYQGNDDYNSSEYIIQFISE